MKVHNRNKKSSYVHSRWYILLVLLILIFLVAKWPTQKALPIWDESVYLGMGKYIYSGGESGLWESIRPLGLPLITGFIWKIGSIDSQFYFSRILLLMFSVATLAMVYIIAKELFDGMAGVIAASLLALSPIFFHHSALVLTDIISTFFLLIAIYFYVKDGFVGKGTRTFFIALFLSFACMFRFPHLIAIVVFFVLMIHELYRHMKAHPEKKREVLKNAYQHVLLFALGLIPVVIFILFNYFMYAHSTANAFDALFKPFILGSFHQNNVFQSVNGFWSNALFYIFVVILANPLFLLAFLCIKLYPSNDSKQRYSGAEKRMVVQSKINALFVMICIYLLYLTYIVSKQERFVLMVLPIMSILASGTIGMYVRDSKTIWKHFRYSVVAALFVVAIFVNFTALKNPYYYDGADRYDEYVRIYRHFEQIPYTDDESMILTTDPVFSVYSDKRFIPFYEMVKSGTGADFFVNSYESSYDYDAVIYTPQSFPCTSIACIDDRQKIYSYFSERFSSKELMNVSGREFHFFRK